jgi:hypothetical protein
VGKRPTFRREDMNSSVEIEVLHCPKGGMCSGCKRQMEDCSDLPFHNMYVIKFDSVDNTAYVRCTEYDPLPREIVQHI